jgi:excisionase family DNA binding protein
MKGRTFAHELLAEEPGAYLTAREASTVLRLGRTATYRLVRSEELPFEHKYGLVCIRKDELQRAVGLAGDDDWLCKLEEVAETTHASVAIVRRWCVRDGLGVKVGGVWRIPFSRLRRFAQERWNVEVQLAEPAVDDEEGW